MKQVLLIYIIIALFAIGFVEGIPSASFNEPTDSGIITRNYILYNFTAFDENLKNASIYLYDNTSTIIQQLNKDAFAHDTHGVAQTGGDYYGNNWCVGTVIYANVDSKLQRVMFAGGVGDTLYIKNTSSCIGGGDIVATSIIDSSYEAEFNYNVTKGMTYCICGVNVSIAAGQSGGLPVIGTNFNFLYNALGGNRWHGLFWIESTANNIILEGNFSNLTYGDYVLNGQAYDSSDNINATDNISISYLCIPDWISSTTACINDEQLITYTDNSSCGTEAPSDNGTMIICGATKVVNVVNKSFISLMVIVILLTVVLSILLYTQVLSDEASKIVIPILIFAIAAVCIIMLVIAFGALKTLS